MRKLGLTLLFLAILVLSACHSAGGENPMPEETGPEILIYATISGSIDREAVDKFNTKHTDVQIQVEDYSENGYATDAGISRLVTEINAGHIPDIIETGYGIQCLPIRQMAQKGYLEDLWPYIENDPEIGRDQLMEAPLKAAEINGKLYEAFSHVRINTLAGRADFVGKRYSWTLDELLETFEKMPEDSTILEYCYSKPDMLYYVCRMVLEGFINLETGECAFDSKEFRTMLEFVNSFPQEVDLSGNINDEIWDRARSGRQMLSMALIGSILDIQRLDAMYSSRTSFPGFPTADGSVGSYFDIGGQELVMSVSCKNKGAAWEFIREKFLPSAAPSESPSAENGIPINKSDFKAWLKFPESGYDVSIGSMEYSYHVPTQEEAARIVNLFNNVNKFQMSSSKVFSIVKEQCGPYFAGDKTLDETVDLVQRRVSLYVSEMR